MSIQEMLNTRNMASKITPEMRNMAQMYSFGNEALQLVENSRTLKDAAMTFAKQNNQNVQEWMQKMMGGR